MNEPRAIDAVSLMPAVDTRKPPKRAYVVKIEIGADDLDGAEAALRQVLTDWIVDGPRTSVSGGATGGTIFAIDHDPTMTHERFVTELNAWLAARRADQAAAEGAGR